jgi:hypothetical protein
VITTLELGFIMLAILSVLEVLLRLWHAAGGVAGARARDADRRRRRQLTEAYRSRRYPRRHHR